ncbi:unnamed protein product [Paramecium sonneborni]|uniref:Alpha-type protein kinase domain-containing protein n=1 Tax=Paramecium sonneborni TaxID=65129 RepID=A0A8S1MQU8_9CILI|nr:unnamed protein product [Paramecium sonneborni]
MLQINFLLPDGSNRFCKINTEDQDQIYYRNICKELKLEWPEEFIALCELKEKKVLSKFYHKLDPKKQYKLFHIQQVISTIEIAEKEIKKQNEENEKLKEEIQNLKILLDAKFKEIQQVKSQSDMTCKEIEDKLRSVEQDLKRAQEQMKYQIQQIQSLEKDLQQNNSAQDANKQDMLNKYQRKVEEIENYRMILWQEKQSSQQVRIQFQQYQQQTYNVMQQWKQYQGKVEYKLNQNQLEKIQFKEDFGKQKKIIETSENDLKQKQNDINQLQSEKYNLEFNVAKLKREILNSQNEYQKELQNQKKQYEDKCNTIEELEQQLKNYKKNNKQLKEGLKREMTYQENFVQVYQNQTLARQFNQNQSDEDKLKQENEILQLRIQQLEANLNSQQSENRDLKIKIDSLYQSLEQIQDEQNQYLIQKDKQLEQQKQQIEKLLKNQDNQNKYQLEFQQEKEKNAEKEIERLNQELCRIIQEKQKIEDDAIAERLKLLNQINESDRKMLEKDQELAALQNQAIVPVYQFRIQRLVEQVPREYFSNIEFAIETMMLQKENPEKFLQNKQAQCKKVDFRLYQVKLNKRAEATLYNISDQDYRQIADLIHIGNITGIHCQTPVQSTDQSLDQYFFFKCLQCPTRKIFEGKIFGIKQCKKQDNEELLMKETAIDNCLATLISQDFMKKFVKELREKKAEDIFDFQFRDQYIIEENYDFKQYLIKLIENQQIQNEGIRNFIDFVKAMSNDQSNDFYDYIKEYQLGKNQPKNQNVIQAFLQIQNDNRLEEINKRYNPEVIKKELNNFIDYIGGFMKEMPQKLFYAIQEIEIKPNFKRYNGGRQHFERINGQTTQHGKFFSAFSYYSIIRSQRQLCISYLQGVQNQLYDPLVSTNDGFLNKFDQGFNEIKNIESKFQSETNINKGIEYMKALGIRWN